MIALDTTSIVSTGARDTRMVDLGLTAVKGGLKRGASYAGPFSIDDSPRFSRKDLASLVKRGLSEYSEREIPSPLLANPLTGFL